MSHRPIVMYLGGFAKVGGIEAFARDFLLAIAAAYPARELVMWGPSGRDHRLLTEIVDSGVHLARSPWRWGCAWNVPDFVLAPQGLKAIRQAAAVIFKRPQPLAIMQWLRAASRRTGRHIPFILIMPYRPGEYWSHLRDSSQIDLFDAITVQSEESVREVKQLGYRGRVENIPLLPPRLAPPVDYPSSHDAGTIHLGFLGRMVPQKNLGYLLAIYRALTQAPDGIRYELHLFGDGPQREELARTCAEMALPNVTFHGELPREEIAAAIDSCDLFLITSLTEGQCLVALEVLSRGRPLVATPVGALPEVIGQPAMGRLAPLDDAGKFAAEVREVIALIRAGHVTPHGVVRAFRLKYDYDSVVKQYLALLADTGAKAEEN